MGSEEETKPKETPWPCRELSQHVPGAALAPRNKGSGGGQPGVEASMISREDTKPGERTALFLRQGPREEIGSKAAGAGNHNSGQDKSQW